MQENYQTYKVSVSILDPNKRTEIRRFISTFSKSELKRDVGVEQFSGVDSYSTDLIMSPIQRDDLERILTDLRDKEKILRSFTLHQLNQSKPEYS